MSQSQHMEALQLANVVRFGISRVKRDVAALSKPDGLRLVAELLREPDDNAGAATIDALILSIHRMGHTRMGKVFDEARFSIAARHRRVRDLTQRQRDLLARLLDELADASVALAVRRTA